MRIPIIVQARMSSQRLPGKMLRPLGEGSMLDVLLQGLMHSEKAKGVVVATSSEDSDAPLAHHCESIGIPVSRGPLENVFERFAATAESLQCDGFVRICGDSPLLDYRLIDKAITIFETSDCDLVTNVHPRSYPKGQSVEVIRTEVFLNTRQTVSSSAHREHVTSFFYDHASDFSIRNFSSDAAMGNQQMSVDTLTDFQRIEAVLKRIDRPHWQYSWHELARIAQAVDEEAAC